MVSASFVASPSAAECGRADLFSAKLERKDRLANCKNVYPLAPGMSFTLDEHAVEEDPSLWFFTSDHPVSLPASEPLNPPPWNTLKPSTLCHEPRRNPDLYVLTTITNHPREWALQASGAAL